MSITSECVRLHGEGKTLAEICEALGVARSRARNLMRQKGVQPRGMTPRNPRIAEECARLHAEGLDLGAIAARVGVDRKKAYEALHARGIRPAGLRRQFPQEAPDGSGNLTKQCPSCGETKAATMFGHNYRTKFGVACWCKECARVRAAARYRARRAAGIEVQHCKLRPVNSHNARLLKERNITHADYEAVLAAQGGVCGICGAATPDSGHRWFSVDHDHATGVVRGLLCGKCNRGIGLLGDSAEALDRAASYLKNPPAPSLLGKR